MYSTPINVQRKELNRNRNIIATKSNSVKINIADFKPLYDIIDK